MFGISYWIIPLFSGCVWLAGLLAMLCTWVAKGEPWYPFMDSRQQIVYISDIGATNWGKPIFIATSAIMVVSFDLVFISERWLRHSGRLAHNYTTLEKVLSIGSIIFSIVGAAGLILLTIFNTAQFPNVHDAMIGVFIGGYVVSAVFVCAGYQRLGHHYPGREHRILRISFWIKLSFIIVEIGMAVAFGVTRYIGHYNKSAILEWIVALVYICYVWSYVVDFLPAVRTRHNRFPPVKRADDEMALETQMEGNNMGGPVYTSGGESAGGGYRGGGGSAVPYYGTSADAPCARNF